jgi:hypothetical protein
MAQCTLNLEWAINLNQSLASDKNLIQTAIAVELLHIVFNISLSEHVDESERAGVKRLVGLEAEQLVF